ncbi:MAG: glutamate racemase [Candidatus Hydrogenedentes bacterium]|nr:glutamate racemase [Candidatus Hydrogenedentota bacterium]
MVDSNLAIGVFDSGVGGLTVVRELARALPEEPIVYLGDTARVPYGTKSSATVTRYALACASILQERGIKILVVACNTASAHGLGALRAALDIPVIGVVEPGAHAAAAATRSGRIGVIGTRGTVSSGAYPEAIQRCAAAAKVFAAPCPLFVPLAEEAWLEGPVPLAAAQNYLGPLLENGIDTLVLGCTHYPLLKETIAHVTGPAVTLVDSAEETARTVGQTLDAMGGRCTRTFLPQYRFLVSDDPDSFARVGALFLGRPLDTVEWVDF